MLALRVGHRTPTGIGRVELAYARYLLENHRHSVRFLVALPRMVQIIPTRVAERYIAATEIAWKYQDKNSAAPQLAALLGCNASVFHGSAVEERRALSRRADRIICAANVLMRAALRRIRPRGLSQFSQSNHRSVYVNVSGSTLNNPWLTKWLKRSPSVAALFLVHDIIPITHPEFVRPSAPKRHARYLHKLSECADFLITNSDFTRDALSGFFTQAGLRLPPTQSMPLGIDAVFSDRQLKLPATKPYFVFISTIEPRKNHLMLLQVWRRLIERHGEDAPKLVLVGARGWENENILDVIDRGDKLKSHVLECRDIGDEVLAALISNARATLLPSHVEGYGLPLAESLALGTPVICSNLAPYSEIAGDIPEYIDPLAGRGWARAIMDYAADESPKRSLQLARLKGLISRRWADHFAHVERALASLGFVGELTSEHVAAQSATFFSQAPEDEHLNIAAE